ncbi:betaine/proline/choline family ABC transporter ATP-binding protein [Streptomyces pathocidini]|uniref:betaine/proline/choline family ABC transporter ATP-binding protein n=1 Tax=Streptomyces pathocidini TaxID=1650571 RepID=UPI003409B9FB
MELDELTKVYPGTCEPAVDRVSMEIPAGETVILVGPSGSGKTTTMKMINRLIEPTSGRIRIAGEDVTDIDPVNLRRHVGYAIQSSGLFPHMTVAENIGLVPGMLGWKKRRIGERVDELLDMVGLDVAEFRGRYPRQLSGGQQQRVGVARALAADPPVLLMDEPFGAVAPITREHLQDELIRIQHELHKTIVFVTHDFDEAIKLGDRIAVLREHSRIAQYDTPEAILTNPADEFVSGFVGAGAALKRLNLSRVRDVEILDCATAHPGDSLESVRNKARGDQRQEVLLLDRDNRPQRWLRRGDLARAQSGSLATAGTPVCNTVTRDATLRDALDSVLTESGGRVVVTRRRGEFAGVVDIATLMNSVQELLEADRLAAEERAAAQEADDNPDDTRDGTPDDTRDGTSGAKADNQVGDKVGDEAGSSADNVAEPIAEAAVDEAVADQATADQAVADQAVADQAVADQAAADKAGQAS